MSESNVNFTFSAVDLASQPVWLARLALALVGYRFDPRFRQLTREQQLDALSITLFVALVELALERPEVDSTPRRYGTEPGSVVHVLNRGRSRCSLQGTPDTWPAGNVWLRESELELATCSPCIWRTKTEQVARALRGYRYRFADEAALQAGVAKVLTAAGLPFEAEVPLPDGAGRLDFAVGTGPVRVAIETKVDGTISQLVRQVHRYVGRPEVGGIVAMVSRRRLANLPLTLGNKPLAVVDLVSSAF